MVKVPETLTALLVVPYVNVPEAGPEIDSDKQGKLVVVLIATEYDVAEDAVLKNTLSELVGTDAPPDPPEVADQLVVVVLSQVPVPPTQYLLAITQHPPTVP
jgi:hypothetical protein